MDCGTSAATTGAASLGGDWELVDNSGNVRRDEDFLGKPQLIYWGFSYCPDVCPTSLMRMGTIADTIDPDGERFHYLFFTVDPERDTPEVMDAYVRSNGFPPGLVGLTGERKAVEAAQAAFKVFAARVEDDASAAEYLYNHSDLIIALDAWGEYLDIIPSDEDARIAARCLARKIDA